MNPFILVYTEIIYRPLLNGLVFIYTILPYHDLGLSILVLTAFVRLLLHPALAQTIRSQQAITRLQPRLREIQSRFKDNKEEQARRTMALYREEGVHPLSGCLPLLVQLPVLIGLYQVFWKGIALQDPSLLYSFLPRLAAFDPRKSRVVELRVFGGLNVDETAEVMNIGAITVKRDWKLALAWLRRELESERPG